MWSSAQLPKLRWQPSYRSCPLEGQSPGASRRHRSTATRHAKNCAARVEVHPSCRCVAERREIVRGCSRSRSDRLCAPARQRRPRSIGRWTTSTDSYPPALLSPKALESEEAEKAPTLEANGVPSPPGPNNRRHSAGARSCARPEERFCCPTRRKRRLEQEGPPIAETGRPPCGALACRR